MSGYVYGATRPDPLHRSAQMIQALRLQVDQREMEAEAERQRAAHLRRRLDRYTKPGTEGSHGNARLWAAAREMEEWQRRNPTWRTQMARQGKARQRLEKESS